MSEIINLIEKNPDSHVYQSAVKILATKINKDYSFIINVWDHEMPHKTKYPKVLISTSDEAHQVPVQVDDSDFVHIFKQYAPMENADIPISVQSISNVTPIPLCHLEGVVDCGSSILSRQYDWSWMGQFDPCRRVEFKNAIDKAAQNNGLKNKVLWYNGWNNGSDTTSYSDIVNQTKIIPVPRGSGSLESFRFFEAMMCGCIVVTVSQPCVDFYDVAPCVYIPSWDNFENSVKGLLKKKEQLEFISLQSRAWYKYFCTPEGLSSYMYRAMKAAGNV
jgi:hypothetical protein